MPRKNENDYGYDFSNEKIQANINESLMDLVDAVKELARIEQERNDLLLIDIETRTKTMEILTQKG
jgi:hypothetical protein